MACPEWLFRLHVCWNARSVLNVRRAACAVSTYTGKGVPQKCVKNARLSSLSEAGKVHVKALSVCVVELSKMEIERESCGVRNHNSCTDQIFVTRHIC